MHVPKWFTRELSFVDPSYYVRTNEQTQVYEIVKDSDIVIPSKMNGPIRITGPKVVDVFRYLNDSALTHLRYRKYLGRQMNIVENPKKELAYLEAQEKAAMRKEKEIGYEMMAEGMYEGYKYEIQGKHSVS